MPNRATAAQAGREIAKTLKRSKKPLTLSKLESETGLDEISVSMGLSWLKGKGYVSKDFRNRWTLNRSRFAVNPKDNPADTEDISYARSQIRRWAKSTGRAEPMQFYTCKGWERQSGKKTRADLVVCCDTKLRRALRRADSGKGSADDMAVMEEFSEVIGDAGFHYKVKPTHIELYSLSINPKEKADEAGGYILKAYGIDEKGHDLFGAIDDFAREGREGRRRAEMEQRRRHAVGRRDPEMRRLLLERLPPEDNPNKSKKKKKKTLKQRAKTAGKKIKKGAKTDVGRAGIGAGAGALVLGPIGAVAGAGIAMATKKDNKKGKKNPGKSSGEKIKWSKSSGGYVSQDFDLGEGWKFAIFADRVSRGKYILVSSLVENGQIHDGDYAYRDSRGYDLTKVKRDAQKMLNAGLYTRLKKKSPKGHSPFTLPPEDFFTERDTFKDPMKKNNKKDKKKNPDKTIKLSSLMGNLLLDYQRVSDHVEHLATATLRGDRVPVSVIRKARADLHKAKKIQVTAAEKEQLGELIEALDRVIEKHRNRTMNPVSLETAIKRQRQKKARKGASRATLASKAASSAGKLSLRKKLASINPSSYVEQVPHLSDKALDGEHKAISNLIARAKRSPEASERMLNDLTRIRKAITEEKRRRRKAARPMARRMSSRSTSRSNPPKSKVKSSVPAGTKITKVKPGKARGAEPLSPYAHEYTEMHERRGSGQTGAGLVPVGVAATYGRRVMGNPPAFKWRESKGLSDTITAKAPLPDGVSMHAKISGPLVEDGAATYKLSYHLSNSEGDRLGPFRETVTSWRGDQDRGLRKAKRLLENVYMDIRKDDPKETRYYFERAKRKAANRGSQHRQANPRKTGRKHGRFASIYTPTQSDLKLLEKYDAFGTIEGKDPRVIEEFMKGLRERDKKSGGFVRDNELDRLAEIYRKRRKRHLFIVTSPDSTPGEIARHQKMVNDAERDLALYAEMRNMEPEDLRKYMEHAKRKQKAAKSRKRKSNPRHTGRKHGRFASMYTPTEADIKLLQKHGAIEAIEGMSPKEIEVFMDRLRMVGDGKRKGKRKVSVPKIGGHTVPEKIKRLKRSIESEGISLIDTFIVSFVDQAKKTRGKVIAPIYIRSDGEIGLMRVRADGQGIDRLNEALAREGVWFDFDGSDLAVWPLDEREEAQWDKFLDRYNKARKRKSNPQDAFIRRKGRKIKVVPRKSSKSSHYDSSKYDFYEFEEGRSYASIHGGDINAKAKAKEVANEISDLHNIRAGSKGRFVAVEKKGELIMRLDPRGAYDITSDVDDYDLAIGSIKKAGGKKVHIARGSRKRKSNPRHTGRKHGRFASMYTPTEADIKLLQKHGAIEALDGMSPQEIEVFMDRLRMVGDGSRKRKSNPNPKPPIDPRYAEGSDWDKRFVKEMIGHLKKGEGSGSGRVLNEVKGVRYGRSVGWDREKMIRHFMEGPSGWLGREVFETSYDDGSMIGIGLAYERFLKKYPDLVERAHAKYLKRKSNPKGRIKQKKTKRKLPIEKGVLTPIPDDIEIERLPMGVAEGHDTFRQREFMHSSITSSKGHYRARKPNPKSWDNVVKGAVQNMSDKELVALHNKQSKKLYASVAPERQFGTEGVKMLESTISLAEKEISRRGLKARKSNPSKPLSAKSRKYMTPVDWAKLNMKNYQKHMKAFDSSMEVDDPDYSCLIAANLDAYGAEINYRDAGDKKNASKMMKERKRISKELSTLLK